MLGNLSYFQISLTKVWDHAWIELAIPGTAVRHASVVRHAALSTALRGHQPFWIQISSDPMSKRFGNVIITCKTSSLVMKKLNSIYIVCIHIHKKVCDCLDYTWVECMHTNLVGLEAAYILSSMGSKNIGKTT